MKENLRCVQTKGASMIHLTSEVCPSKIVTSELGIWRGWDVDVVHISIGSGPTEANEKNHAYLKK
jgi:hypothetical protein